MTILLPSTITSPRPSYSSGFTHNAAESDNPGSWKRLASKWESTLGVTGGTLRDVSGRKNHSTLSGATWVASEKGTVIRTDGTDDYVEILGFSLLGDLSVSPFSFGGWFTWDPPAGTENAMCISRTSANNHGMVITTRSSGTIRFEHDGGTLLADSGITPTAGRWYHVIATWDGTTPKIYTDSVAVSGAGALQAITPTQVYIGRYKATSFFDPREGKTGPVGIWNRPLPASEIQQLYVDPDAMLRLRQQYFPGAAVEESSSSSSISTSSSSSSSISTSSSSSSISTSSSSSSSSSISTSSSSSSISTSSVIPEFIALVDEGHLSGGMIPLGGGLS